MNVSQGLVVVFWMACDGPCLCYATIRDEGRLYDSCPRGMAGAECKSIRIDFDTYDESTGFP